MRKKIFICAFLILTLTIFIKNTYVTSPQGHSYDNLQKSISNKIIRFHVIGNSNSKYDQALKLKIKNAIVDYMSPKLNSVTDLNTAREIIEKDLNNMNNIAKSILLKHNTSYSVKTKLSTRFFPVKKYGDLILPEGEYNSVCVELGNASGKNWWCVLYPSLCFIDCSYTTLPIESKNKLKNTLTLSEYHYVINKPSTKVKYTSILTELFS